MQAVDLHVHSNRSDGTYSPTQLVDYAMEKGLAAIALTDHDTVDGLDEIIAYAESLRRQSVDAACADSKQPENSLVQELSFDASGNAGKQQLPSQAPGCTAGQSHLSVIPGCTAGQSHLFVIPGSTPGQLRMVPEIIPGIEFSTEYEGKDVHILGLYIDYKDASFQKPLQDFVNSRIIRNEKMCRLLQDAGIDITYEKLLAQFPDSVITRAHYASYLLSHGYTQSMNEGFERYVGDHCPYFVPREKVTPAQAVELILKAKGVPILAHPPLYHMSDSRLDKLVATLKDAGLMGIEAIYSTYSSGEERDMHRLADKYDLLISGGSDFHGANKPRLDLGTGYGKLYVDYSILEKIKSAAF